MPERRALVAGATGLVGRHVLARLLGSAQWGRITVVGRRPPAFVRPRLETVVAELDSLGAALAGGRWDDAFCCLGTTMKKAGAREAFRAVDLDGVAAFADAARAGEARYFGLVSAAGADPASRNFYLRTKGEAEAAVGARGFASVAIARPGVLRGDRRESRPGERLAILVAPVTDLLMQGPLARYRSVAAADVADALVAAALEAAPGLRLLDPEAIGRLARESSP